MNRSVFVRYRCHAPGQRHPGSSRKDSLGSRTYNAIKMDQYLMLGLQFGNIGVL
jgi:hypothetical protein